MSEVPKKTILDYLHTITKAGLGALPSIGDVGIGSIAAEFFSTLIVSPIEKRREEWMVGVSKEIAALQENGSINIEELAQDEKFIDVVIQASNYAIKTSQAEKVEYFKNAITNTALDHAPDVAKASLFLNIIDRFSVWHIKILDFISDPTEWYRKAGTRQPSYSMGGLSTIINDAFPELKQEEALLEMVWRDLKDCGFHRTADIHTTMSGSGLMERRITSFGQEFLNFINRTS